MRDQLDNYAIVAVAWHAAGQHRDGHNIGCLAEDMTSDRDAATAWRRMIVRALAAESDWTGDCGAGDGGRIDDHDGEAIYWWDNNAETAWTSDRPEWWIDPCSQPCDLDEHICLG